MNTKTINKRLHHLKGFVGAFPLDNIPKPRTLPYGVIVNTHPSQLPGEHWVAIFITKDGLGEYFDSFGLPPLKKQLNDFLEVNTKAWLYNKHALQHITSDTCGNYCILFMKYRFKGMSFCRLLSMFTTNKKTNDVIISSF